MAYEYLATMDQTDKRPWSALIQAILPNLPVEVLSVSDEEVRLRWSTFPRRSEWPEDVTVSKDANGILISFHFGSADQRKQMLDCMNQSFHDDHGTAIKFVEV